MKANIGLSANNVPLVSSRILPFWVEPARVFSPMAHLPGSVLLESQPGSIGARYSVICTEPFGTLHTICGRTFSNLPDGSSTGTESPFEKLRDVLSTRAMPPSAGARFAGGSVGYLGYELRTFVEDVPISASDDLGLPDCWIGFYDCAAVFDHKDRTIALNACTLHDSPDRRVGLETLEDLILRARNEKEQEHSSELPRPGAHTPSSSFTRAGYCAAVREVKEYIAAGHVYQVNLSQRFTAPVEMDAWDVYLRLRKHNPAPYAAYLNAGDFQVVSSSPECFLALDPASRLVTTRPIKGTRPRSADPAEDARLASELAASAKDIAENIMIVDLERNDLGRVCEFGSVAAPDLAVIESHPTVHHLVSTITGRLRRDHDVLDLLTACFPGGSITGAPKIRAMEIIDELETVRRGVYTGSIGYLGFDGSANLNIAIRTAVVKDGFWHLHVGGGIVADSDPEMEYQETLDKGRAFFEVLGCPQTIEA